MRWEVGEFGGVTIVNDAYNANPMSMRAAIETFAGLPCKGRRWLVLGDMLELGEASVAAHRRVGTWVAGCECFGLVAVGPESAEMAQAALAGGMSVVTHVPLADEASEWLAGRVAAGDAVLLKASRGIGLERVMKQISEIMGCSTTCTI